MGRKGLFDKERPRWGEAVARSRAARATFDENLASYKLRFDTSRFFPVPVRGAEGGAVRVSTLWSAAGKEFAILSCCGRSRGK